MSTTHLEHIKAKLAELKKGHQRYFDEMFEGIPQDYLLMYPEQWLNLLSIIEAQAEALNYYKSKRHPVYQTTAEQVLEQTCKLLGVGDV